MGSFINCLAFRSITGESVFKGRSHCPNCQHTLSPLDLVPVLSWIILRGRCRYCHTKIAARYMVTELMSAVFFISIVAAYGLSIHALGLCALGCVLLGLSLIDLETYTIPNGYIIAGILAWATTFAGYTIDPTSVGLGSLMLAFTPSPFVAVLLDSLLGAFIVAGALWGLAVIFDKAIGRQSLGGGDIKLVFMVGLFLGVAASVLNLIVACIIGILFALVTQKSREGMEDPRAFPFGPSIAVATWITLIVGPIALTAYFSLF